MFKSKMKGFSLLELVVVLAVMGTLAAVAVPAYNAVTDNSSSGALISSADGLAKSGTGKAQSDVSDPGRGVSILDIDISQADDAVLSNGVITVFGQKDQCITISVSGSNSDAEFVVSDVKDSSNVTSANGRVTGGQCDATVSSTPPTTNASVSGGGSPETTVAPTTTTTVAASVVYAIGDVGPGGGRVFYVHASGTFACGATLASTCKYLEVAPNTWSGGSTDPQTAWAVDAHQMSDVTAIMNEASIENNALQIGLGYQHSLAIINQGNDATAAAGAARAYTGGSQSDWYLPTAAELNLLCQWASNVAQDVTTPCTGGTLNTGTGASGGFSTDFYWSSSEVYSWYAAAQNFSNGDQDGYRFKGNSFYVRPVRAFN